MTDKQKRQYVLDNPDGLTEEAMGKLLGYTRDKVHGIRKKRAPVEVDLEKWKAEVKFVLDNTNLMTDTQIAATLSRLMGRRFTTFWIRRVRKKCGVASGPMKKGRGVPRLNP